MSSMPAVHKTEDSQYAVMLPCTKEDFREFIAGLLGKSQTIEVAVGGTFDVSKDDLINLYHLVDQRIAQQNDASLVQFSVQIGYDDFSSVLLNSLEEFTRYAEVRPHLSHTATLTWIYLVRFNGKSTPEKQEISITFRTKSERNSSVLVLEEMLPRRQLFDLAQGEFFVQIRHTARSWGVDMESLLTGHLATLRLKESEFRRILNRSSGYLGWFGALLMISATAAGVYLTMLRFSEAQIKEFKALLIDGASKSDSSVLEGLGSVILSGAYPRFTVAMIFFILAMLLFSIVFGFILCEKASAQRCSFLTLTKTAEIASKKARQSEGAYSNYFFGTFVGGVISGIVGNAIFLYMFGG